MHGVDEQPEVGSSDIFQGGHRGRQVADRQAGYRFDVRLDVALGTEFGQCGELVERAAELRIEADDVYPGNAELRQDVEIGAEVAHIGTRQHQEPVAE